MKEDSRLRIKTSLDPVVICLMIDELVIVLNDAAILANTLSFKVTVNAELALVLDDRVAHEILLFQALELIFDFRCNSKVDKFGDLASLAS